MKRAILFGAGLVLGFHPGVADAQSAPPASIAGIVVGGPMSAVDAKCKEPGVACVRRPRKAAGVTLDRVRMTLPSGDFTRVVVLGKDGTVLSAKGRYRVVDPDRMRKLRTSLGPGALRRGQLAWAPPSGVVTSVEGRGLSITYVDTKAASSKGFGLTPQDFVSTISRTNNMVPLASTSPRPSRLGLGTGIKGTMVGAEQSSPQVTPTYRIPVKLTLGKLYCVDENDRTSIIYGDDPYLKVVGTHTSPSFPKAWSTSKSFSDVEESDSRDVNLPVFPDGDARRFVGYGEAVGIQVTLFEGDWGNDDELDAAYPIIDYAYALANQNKTMEQGAKLAGDGGNYWLTWKLEIGAAQPDPSAYAFSARYRAVDARLYAGNFAGGLGNAATDASLTFVASRDPQFPNGVLYGQIKDGGVIANLRTVRLLGDAIELVATYPTGSAGTLVGYLVGDGGDRRLVGTLTRDGVTRGVSLQKK